MFLSWPRRTGHLKTIELIPTAKELSAVTVTGRRPLIEQHIDRMVVNVDAAVTNVGATAWKYWKNHPVLRSTKTAISPQGQQGVQVYRQASSYTWRPCLPLRLILPSLSSVIPGDFSNTPGQCATLVTAASTLTTMRSICCSIKGLRPVTVTAESSLAVGISSMVFKSTCPPAASSKHPNKPFLCPTAE